jgi:trimeric autotransporter adhesin
VNTAANPVKIGGYISLYATGEGQTTPTGVDGKVASGPVLPMPNLPVSATVGGIPAVVQYAGGAPGEVAGVRNHRLKAVALLTDCKS